MEQETKTYEMTCIAPNGVGFGDGSISLGNRLESGAEHPLTPEQLQLAQETLIANRDRIIVPVDENDDGCGDGRRADRVFQVIDGRTGSVHEYTKSKKRAKIFGGGLQVAASMWRAINGEPTNAETVLGDRKFIAGELKKWDIQYGAHTDNHAKGENCGCGAIDRYIESTEKSGIHRGNITDTLAVFYDDDFMVKKDAIDQAFVSRAAIAGNEHYMSNASGRETMNFIEGDGAVVKQLADGHLEALTVINAEPGTTVDQEAAAALFAEAGLPEGIQLFVIDEWRGRMYADIVAEIAAAHGYDKQKAYDIALADFYINQLSVAATLTDGTQPVLYNR